MEKVRVAVAGIGTMGNVHTTILKSFNDVDLVGIAEINTDKHKEIKEKYKANVSTDIRDFFPKVDAIHVCTPDNVHTDIILDALAAGIKVFVEKPLAISYKDAQKILAAMPDQTYLMVGHSLRFDPRLWRAKCALDSGEIGEIVNIRVRRSNSLWAGRKICDRTSVTWFLGIHDIDAIHWLTGLKVKSAQAIGRKVFQEFWDSVFSICEMDNGAIMCMENNFLLPDQRMQTLDAGINIIGTKGMIDVDLSHHDFRITNNELNRTVVRDTFGWYDWDETLYGNLRNECRAFIDAVKNNTVPPTTAEQGTEAVRVIQMIEDILDKQETQHFFE